MLGRNHATIGAIAALAAAPAVTTDPLTIVLATTCVAGAAVLPDLDHPKASVSNVIPIIGPLLAGAVALFAGGHRNRTHTLEAAAAATGGAWVATTSRPASAIVIAFLVCFAVALLGPHLQLVRAASLAEFVVAAAAGVYVWKYTTVPVAWLPMAVGAGYVAHLLADAVTISGIRPLMIVPKAKLRLGWLRTGSHGEAAIGSVAVVALAALVYIRVARPLLDTVTA